MENRPASVVSMIMREGPDRRRYNAPLHEEVAAIFTGNDGAPPTPRDIVCLLYTSPSPRDATLSRMPSSA